MDERLIAQGRCMNVKAWALPMIVAFMALLAPLGCATIQRADYIMDAQSLDIVADLEVSGYSIQVGISCDGAAPVVCLSSPVDAPVCVQASPRGQ